MFSLRNVVPRRILAAAAVGLMLGLPAAAQTAAKPTLLVFPFDKPENVDASITGTLGSAFRNRLQAMAKYDYMTFNTRSALVQRAISGGDISREASEGPFDVPGAAEITRALELQYALIGMVDDAQVDVATNTATVTASAQLLNARDGQVLQNAAATSTASESGVAADALLRRAADDAAAKLVVQLFPDGATPAVVAPINTAAPTTPTVNVDTGIGAMPTGSIPVEKKGKKKSNNLLLMGGVLLLGILIAGGGGGGGNGGGNGGGGNPPPIPL